MVHDAEIQFRPSWIPEVWNYEYEENQARNNAE